jgi:hypothetical protein
MPEELLDWADPRFLGHLLAHLKSTAVSQNPPAAAAH